MNFAIGIPTINCYDLLQVSLEKYLNKDFSTTKIFIIDNGMQDINIYHPNLTVIQSNKNLGVAGSWNVLLTLIYEKHDYAFILNDDVYLGKNELEIQELLNTEHYDFYVTYRNWCSFILPKTTYKKVGGFDSIFYPAYFEDNSYHYRMQLEGCSYHRTNVLDTEIFLESMTIKKDPTINKDFDRNKQIYIDMWGGPPHHETYIVPFNCDKELEKKWKNYI